MAVKFANNVSTSLSAAINATQTTISVADASGLPTLSSGDYMYLTIDTDTNSPTIEVVKVTAISSNDLTVVRGQDGTTASSFSNGTKIELRVTAAALDDISSAADTESVSISGDTMTGNLTVPSLIGTNAIVSNVIAKGTNGNILIKTNGGSSIARFNNDLSANFFGGIQLENGNGLKSENVAGSPRTLISLGTDNVLRIKGNDSETSANGIYMVNGGAVGIGRSPDTNSKLHVDGHIYVDTGHALYSDNILPYATYTLQYGNNVGNGIHNFLGRIQSNGTTIIDSSRNATLGTISSGAITSTGAITAQGASGGFFYAEDTTTGATNDDLLGGFLFKNNDTSGTQPHYAGMTARAVNIYGAMALEFFADRADYENDTPALRLEPESGTDSTNSTLNFLNATKITGVNSISSGTITTSGDLVSTDSQINIQTTYNNVVYTGGYAAVDYFVGNTSLRAPIFYDVQNTSYYLDPASTGTSLNVAGGISTGGSIGINVASPSSALDIRGTGTGGSQKNTIAFGTSGWGAPLAPNAALDGGVKLALFEGSTQKVQIGMDGNARLWLMSAGSGAQGVDIYTGSSNTAAPSLRLRVDQSGTTNIYGALSATGNITAGTGTFEGGGNTLLLKKGTGTPAIAFAGTASDPQTTALIEGISGGGLKIYTSSGTISSPSWSPKFTLAANGNVSITNDLTVSGNFSVLGTTTTLNTATLQVEDKNIVLNYGTGDTSGSADGAGITIQDAVSSSTDATILWDATDDEFDFSHPITVASRGDVVYENSGTKSSGNFNNFTTGGNYVISNHANISNSPPNSYAFGLLRVTQLSGTGIVTQEYIPHSSGEGTFIRFYWSPHGWTSWRESVTFSSDGTGTGLDADLLDGHDSGSFLRSNVTDNYTSGTLSFNSGTALKMLSGSNFDTSSGDVYANMRVIRNSGTANLDGMYIGYANANSGVTRLFGEGGTTNGVYVYSDHTRVYGSTRSPLFYDLDNTAYYGDFASTSNINNLVFNTYLSSSSTSSYISLGSYLKLWAATGSNTGTLSINASYDGAQTDSWTPSYSGDANAGMFLLRQSSGGSGTMQVWQKVHGTTSSSTGRSTFTKTAEFNQSGYLYGRNIRSEIFYDNDNTTYYANPGNNSILYSASIGHTSAPSGGYSLRVGSIQSANGSIDYLSQVHFNDNVRFYDDGNDSYLNFKYGDTNNGGIKILNGSSAVKGYLYANNNGFGLLDSDGDWAVRTQAGTSPLKLYADNNPEFEVHTSYTLSPGSSRAPIFYDSNDTAFYVDPNNGGYVLQGGTNNRVTFTTVDSGLRVQNAEGTGEGDLRLGAAWGRTGIYSQGIMHVMSDSTSGISFIIDNTEYGKLNTDYLSHTSDIRAPLFYDSNNTGFYLDPANSSFFNQLSASKLQVDSNLVLDLTNNSTARGPWNPIASSIRSSGYPVYNDEDFQQGLNGVGVYNNSGGNAVTITRVTASSESLGGVPNSSNYVVKIAYLSSNTNGSSPGFGGFHHNIPSEENHTFVQVFQAKLPSGRSLNIAENPQGNNNTSYWLTNNVGTGKWEWYVRVSHCGTGGTFSSGGHVYVSGGTNANFTWYLASINVYDVTEANHQRSYQYTANSRMDSPIYYDSGNTAYYVDPASTSRINVLATTAGTSTFNSGRIALRADGIEDHTTNTDSGFIQVNYYGYQNGFSRFRNFDVYNGKGGLALSVQGAGGYTQINGSTRSPIFYDLDNTAYYTNPAGTSVFSKLSVGTTSLSTGYNMQLGGPINMVNNAIHYAAEIHFNANSRFTGVSTETLDFKAAHSSNAYLRFRDGGGNIKGGVYGSGTSIGLLDSDSNWAIKHDRDSRTGFYINNVEKGFLNNDQLAHVSSVRAPYFYDSDNTNYYLNAASESRLNVVHSNNYQVEAGNGAGIGFWGGSGGSNYSIYMSSQGDGTYGGRVAGEGTSDYNMYFRMSAGTNRGFVFRSGNTNHSGIDASGNARFSGIVVAGAAGTQSTFQARYNASDSYHGALGWNYLQLGNNGSNRINAGRTNTGGHLDIHTNVTGTNTGGTHAARFDTAGNVYSYGSSRSPIFYDSNNTGFYVNPASTSKLNTLAVTNIHDAATNGGRATMYMDGNFHLDAKGSNDIFANYYSGRRFRTFYGSQSESFRTDTDGIVYAYNQFRTPFIYDYNNTSFYLDPASTSVLSTIKADDVAPKNAIMEFTGVANGSFSFTNPSGGSAHYTARGGRVLTSNSSGWHQDGEDPTIAIVDSHTGTDIDSAGIGLIMHNEANTTSAYSPGMMWTARSSSSNYDSMYAAVYGRKTGTGPDTNWNAGELHFFTVGSSAYTTSTPDLRLANHGDAFVKTSVRAPTFYDKDNAAYYTNPAGNSNQVTLTLNNGGGNGSGAGLTINGSGDIDLMSGGSVFFGSYNYSNSTYIRGYESASGFRFHVAGTMRSVIESTQLTHDSSIRSPIFYDVNNTGYYSDNASTSRFNVIHSNDYKTEAGDGRGIGFWNGAGGSAYSIFMSAAGNGTYGGRVGGETTSDYNMYFRMGGGTNRGWVFTNGAANPVAGIDASGNIRAEGNVVAYSASDRKLKDNIKPIENALDKVCALNGYTFNWNDQQTIHEAGKADVGVIAQEVIEQFPEVCKERTTAEGDTHLGVDYERLVPALIGAIRELEQKVHSLEEKLR